MHSFGLLAALIPTKYSGMLLAQCALPLPRAPPQCQLRTRGAVSCEGCWHAPSRGSLCSCSACLVLHACALVCKIVLPSSSHTKRRVGVSWWPGLPAALRPHSASAHVFAQLEPKRAIACTLHEDLKWHAQLGRDIRVAKQGRVWKPEMNLRYGQNIDTSAMSCCIGALNSRAALCKTNADEYIIHNETRYELSQLCL